MRVRSAPRGPAAFVLLAGLLAAALPVLGDSRITVAIKVDATPQATRLVLTHASPVGYELRELEDRLEIVYAAAVAITPPDLRIDDSILARYALEEGRTLVLFKGPGYRGHESFELRNPLRLIVDCQGSRGEGPPAETPGAIGATREAGARVVVLDPGHGGVESGAVGPTGLQEKDVTLDLARRVRDALSREERLEVVLTREDDRLVGLDERTAIANHNRAELFLSIHLNASTRAGATGAETYFLSSESTDDEARTLAAMENSSAGVDVSDVVTADGERRRIELVLWDLAQNRFLAESSVLAESLQQRLNALTGTRDRGVRQAPFRVLEGATMPAVLVEVGFVSNAAEESKLRSNEYRDQIAAALARAIVAFLTELERLGAPPPASAVPP